MKNNVKCMRKKEDTARHCRSNKMVIILKKKQIASEVYNKDGRVNGKPVITRYVNTSYAR